VVVQLFGCVYFIPDDELMIDESQATARSGYVQLNFPRRVKSLNVIQIWSTASLSPIYVLDPYLETGAGDLFSLAWSPSLQTIYIGCQNTALQWYDFHEPISSSSFSSSPPGSSFFADFSTAHSGTSTPSANATVLRKAHRFFDSYPQYERKPADIYAKNGTGSIHGASSPESEHYMPAAQGSLAIPASNVIDSAHYGYIYCMALLEGDTVQLATGSGDETVKVSPLLALSQLQNVDSRAVLGMHR
jgi:di- and tripeptidase